MIVIVSGAMCGAWFERHPELQPWHNDWPYCQYDTLTGMCLDEYGDAQKCGDALFIEDYDK